MSPQRDPVGSTRRDFLKHAGGGLGSIALAVMLAEESARASSTQATHGVVSPLHHPAKAKRVIQLFMAGGASHLDLYDFKSELVKRHGQPADFGEPVETFQDGLGPWLAPIWPFRPHGECGKPLADIIAPLGKVVDQLCFIHNMVGKTGVHSQATLLQTTGFQRPGFPGMGCWVSYALGSLRDELPTFVVLPDGRGLASNGTKNWDSAFLPTQHQGTVIYPERPTPIVDLFPKSESLHFPARSDKAGLELLKSLNQEHLKSRSDGRLDARIQSYELAAGMQLAAPEALDISGEPKHILAMYGLDDIPSSFPTEINSREETILFSRKCLVARRLLERGVRFVQIWSGNDNGFPRRNWDSHEDVARDHGPLAAGMAHGAAALVQDLRQSGLLEDTIVLWTTEFGRMPSSQGGKGRDHNPFVFTNWLAGGGIKGGISHGLSDEFGYKPADRENGTQVYDIHATILHLLGIDHTKLTVRNNGIDRRLTDVHGHVIKEIL
ncbi:DUF1501 domain-containing protein [bacterium]|nr:DUF1501 domain-containing protein [bacterium]